MQLTSYILKLVFIMIYIVSTLIVTTFNISVVGEIFLLALFIICFLILLINTGVLSLGKLFVVVFFALNFTSMLFFAFDAQEGNKYLLLSHLAFGVFCFSYQLLSTKQDSILEKNIYEELDKLKLTKVFVYILYLPILMSIIIMLIEFGPSALLNVASHTRADTKEASGFLWALSKYMLMLYIPCCFIQGVNFYNFSTKGKLNFILIFVSLLMLVFLFVRTRTYLIGPMVPFGLGVLFSGLGHKGGDIKVSTVKYLKICLVSLIVISIAASARFARGIMEVGEGQLNFEVIVEKTLIEGDLGYGHMINKIIEYSDEYNQKLNGQSYYRLIFAPIPRAIFKEKPENTQRIVGLWLYPSSAYMTLPPGVQGDSYINFGFLGVFTFFIYGIVFRYIDNRKNLLSAIFIASSFMPVFHFVRGGFTNPILIFTFTFIFAASVYVFIRKYGGKLVD